MGFLDFLKKPKQEEENKKILFKNLEEEVERIRERIEENQKEPRSQIKENLIDLLQQIEQGRDILEEVSLEDKKAPERAKLIVRENLIKFKEYLEKLICELREIKEEPLEEYINKINTIFTEFEKKSSLSFEKSTFLIGKELEDIRKAITGFYKNFNKIVKDNQQSIEKSKIVSSIEVKIKKINEIKDRILKNEKEIKELGGKVKGFEEKILILEKKYEETKRSPEHLKQIEAVRKSEELGNQINNKLKDLKALIDFKLLAKIYHSSENKMRLVKEYKENFKEAFEKYGAENLIEILDIREIDQEALKQKIAEIASIREKISEIKVDKDRAEEIEKEISAEKRKIEEFSCEISEKQRGSKRLMESLNKTKQEVDSELIKINFVLIG